MGRGGRLINQSQSATYATIAIRTPTGSFAMNAGLSYLSLNVWFALTPLPIDRGTSLILINLSRRLLYLRILR